MIQKGARSPAAIGHTCDDLRDHSKLNQHTPIISAGLAEKLGGKQDEVNLLDTIEFLRQNGIDKLVDGYGVHLYPSADPHRPVLKVGALNSFPSSKALRCTPAASSLSSSGRAASSHQLAHVRLQARDRQSLRHAAAETCPAGGSG
jgi:hypothetical protein